MRYEDRVARLAPRPNEAAEARGWSRNFFDRHIGRELRSATPARLWSPVVAGRCRVALAAEDVKRDIGLLADDPAVVSGRNVEEVPRLHQPLSPVVHLGDGLPAEYESDMLHLARCGAYSRRNVLRPSPAGLVGGSTHRYRPHPVELEAALLEVPCLTGLIEADQLKVQGLDSPFSSQSRSCDAAGHCGRRLTPPRHAGSARRRAVRTRGRFRPPTRTRARRRRRPGDRRRARAPRSP